MFSKAVIHENMPDTFPHLKMLHYCIYIVFFSNCAHTTLYFSLENVVEESLQKGNVCLYSYKNVIINERNALTIVNILEDTQQDFQCQ